MLKLNYPLVLGMFPAIFDLTYHRVWSVSRAPNTCCFVYSGLITEAGAWGSGKTHDRL